MTLEEPAHYRNWTLGRTASPDTSLVLSDGTVRASVEGADLLCTGLHSGVSNLHVSFRASTSVPLTAVKLKRRYYDTLLPLREKSRRMSVYDDNDALNRSPQLTPVTVDIRPTVTPPPFRIWVDQSTQRGSQSAESGSSGGRKRRPKRHKNVASQGDVNLLNALDPNRPDIARAAGERLPPSASHSESSGTPESSEGGMAADVVQSQMSPAHMALHLTRNSSGKAEPTRLSATPLTQQPAHVVQETIYHKPIVERPLFTRSSRSRSKLEQEQKARAAAHALPLPGVPVEVGGELRDAAAANGLLRLKDAPPEKPANPGDTIAASSPTLAQHLIPQSQISPTDTLPALEGADSPTRGATGATPQADYQLPPVQPLLEMAINENEARSERNRTRGSSFGSITTASSLSPSMIAKASLSGPRSPRRFPRLGHTPSTSLDRSPPDLYKAISPSSTHNSIASHQHHRRRAASDTLPPPLVIMGRSTDSRGSIQSNTSASTEGYASSTQRTPSDRASFDGLRPQHPYPQPYLEAAQSTGVYRCTHPGCTAPSFQTQYLLNSHANVHSQVRPHYCPVKGCPRGEGGKGFKRKNEMIRHGLVHDSPGYVCPYCPDKEHRYPRPDNLQRHVRMHHEDMKDDPRLREVLAQRSQGGNRGRRKKSSVGS